MHMHALETDRLHDMPLTIIVYSNRLKYWSYSSGVKYLHTCTRLTSSTFCYPAIKAAVLGSDHDTSTRQVAQ